ncbi:MAG: restriction endonuclease subunit S [Bacteroidales bacterium]|nr:restriction endonuclease subunit S [Bacteroidales bacterium]
MDEINDDDWVVELEDIEKDSGRLLRRIKKKDRPTNGSRHCFKEGKVLYSKLRTYLNKVLIADRSGYCTTEIIPITSSDAVVPDYLCQVLRSPYFLDYTERCGYGVKMPRLGTSDARNAIIPVPPIKEQRRIAGKVQELINNLNALSQDDSFR